MHDLLYPYISLAHSPDLVPNDSPYTFKDVLWNKSFTGIKGMYDVTIHTVPHPRHSPDLAPDDFTYTFKSVLGNKSFTINKHVYDVRCTIF